MAEPIFSPSMAALLRSGRVPALPPPMGPMEEPHGALAIAELMRAGLLDPNAVLPSQQLAAQQAAQQQPMRPTLSGAENRAPAGPPQPGLGQSMASFLRGVANPLGIPAPPPMTVQSPVSTLTGREQNLTLPSTIDFNPGANADPAAEMVGSMVGFGPATRTAGAGYQALRQNPTLAGLLTSGMGIGGIAALSEPTPAGAQRRPPPSEEVKALQRKMAAEGLYSGPIDGILEQGGPTQKAKTEFEARERQRAKDRERQQQLELESSRTDVEREKIKLKQQEENRLKEEGTRSAELAKQGSEQLKNMKPSFMEQWGPMAGGFAGLGLGALERMGIGRLMNLERRELAGRAGGMAREMGQGEVPDRVARVNEFWRQGAPASPPPFGFQSGRQPFPWTANPAATPAGQLFPPPRGFGNWGPIGITAGKGVVEGGVGGGWILAARSELQDAEKEVNKPNGATPAAVQRLELARERLAQAETTFRFGLGESIGAGVGELESRLTTNKLRPAVNAAEAERGRLDPLLNPQPQRPDGPPRVPRGQPGAGRFLPWRR